MMGGGGPRFPVGTKARALEVARTISLIPNSAERVRTARAVCLEAVTKHPAFPEVEFLRLCNAPVSMVEGKALRVKKTIHGVRTQAAGETKWGEVYMTSGRRSLYRQASGISEKDLEAYVGEGDSGQFSCCHKSLSGEPVAYYSTLCRMW